MIVIYNYYDSWWILMIVMYKVLSIYLSVCLSVYLSKLRARLDRLPAPGGGSLLPPLRPGRQRRTGAWWRCCDRKVPRDAAGAVGRMAWSKTISFWVRTIAVLSADLWYMTWSGWWFGTWLLLFHILGIIIPTDELHHFSEGYPLVI